MDPSAHHYGLTVDDLDRAVEFYTETFGFEIEKEFSVSGAAFETATGVENATGEFVYLDAGGVRLELVEYDPEGDGATASEVNQPGATHLGLGIEDVDEFYEGLPASVTTISEPETTASGSRILFVRDPEGNLVELIES